MVPGVPGSGCGDVLFPLCRSAVKVIYTSFFDYKLTVKGMQFSGFKNYVELFTQDPCSVALKNTIVGFCYIPARSFRRAPGAGTES